MHIKSLQFPQLQFSKLLTWRCHATYVELSQIHFNKKSPISLNNLAWCTWLLLNPSVQPGTSRLCTARICLPCLHAFSSCCLLLLITGNLRTTHVQINIPTRGSRAERQECQFMGVGFIQFSYELRFYIFFCSLSFTFFLQSVCLFVLCSQHYISRPADHMLAAGLSQFNTDLLASSASSVHAHDCVCVCMASLPFRREHCWSLWFNLICTGMFLWLEGGSLYAAWTQFQMSLVRLQTSLLLPRKRRLLKAKTAGPNKQISL